MPRDLKTSWEDAQHKTRAREIAENRDELTARKSQAADKAAEKANSVEKARRAGAEHRVRQQDDKRMKRLAELQEQARELDEEQQAAPLDALYMREAQLKEDRYEALRLQEVHWAHEQQKLSPQASRAPVFGLGAPSEESVEARYRKMEHAHKQRCAAITENFDRQQRAIEIDRADLNKRHAQHNERRDSWQAQKRDELAEKQERTFEARVEKEMAGAERSLGNSFARARDTGRER